MENRTNELLKEIELILDKHIKRALGEISKINKKPWDDVKKFNSKPENFSKIYNSGRLDALKEEVKFIKSLDGLNKACWNLGNWNIIKTRLASIQEEIKLIEEKI